MSIHSIIRKFERLRMSIDKSKPTAEEDVELIATITYNKKTGKTTVKRVDGKSDSLNNR